MTTPNVHTPLLTSDEELACDLLFDALLAELDGSVVPLERPHAGAVERPARDGDDVRVA